MKKRYYLIFFPALFCFQTLPAQILPTPMETTVRSGFFRVNGKTSVSFESVGEGAADYLAEFLNTPTGFKLAAKKGRPAKKKNSIHFTTEEADTTLGREGYILEITPNTIVIRAIDEAGMFYAVQSLLQLLPPEVYANEFAGPVDWNIPCAVITDKPKYSWRSFMLDSGRQYQSPDFIRKYLDIMAMLKMNVFHWHLTEGLGWRLEIDQYPRLTEIGSRVADGKEQQGFYSKEEVRALIQYAADRHIMIVPEIDMPGHSEAAQIAYPELSCLKKAPPVSMSFTPNLFCGGDEETYVFLQNVLDEVCELFPSPYIHLGGDEAPKDVWDACKVCQNRIREEGLEDSHDLQLYFSRRLALYLKEKNKKTIFWDDVVHEGGDMMPDNVVIQWWNWRGHKRHRYNNAIKHGYPVIAGTNYYCYLNFPVSPWEGYKENRTFDLRTVYESNPSDIKDPNPLIMGMSALLWCDYNVQQHMVDRRVFPRIYALAEQMWSLGSRMDYESFYRSVKTRYPALIYLDIDYGPAGRDEIKEGFSWE